MKTERLKNALLGGLIALALAPSASFAASDILIQPAGSTVMTDGFGNQCSSSGGGGTWQNWFVNIPGVTNYSIVYDTANPPPTGSAGSMKQTQGWDGTSGGTLSTFACVDGNFWGGQKVDMTQYSAIEMDFKYDTTSDMTPVTDQGFDFGVNAANNSSSVPINLRLIYNTGTEATNFDGAWHHLITPIPANIANADASEGPGFKIFHPITTTGSFNYWIANIKLVARIAPVPPPTVTLDKVTPGLRMFADVTPNYNRQDLRTDTTPPGSKNIDWIGHPGATYSWTVSDFPSAGHPNFQIAFALTPDAPETMTYADPDWSSTNVLWLQIQGNNDGSVRSSLAWKTNQPSANSQLYGSGQLYQNFNTPTAIGTWSLSFPNNNSVTLTAPGGLSTNVAIPADMFLVPYTGISCALMSGMNNNDSLLGQSVTISSFKITGVADPVNEDLTDGGLSTPFLVLQSQNYGQNATPPNQVFAQSSDAYWLHWTLPDANFFLVQKTNLAAAFWLDYTPGNTFLNGSARWVLASKASLPSASSSYFALQQRTNSQMQVLLPGENPAPNTLTGKTGTPTPVSLGAGGTIDVIVRAVDSHWNLIPSTDTVNISTTDGTATATAEIPLVGGQATFTALNALTFGSTGTFTVSATNVTKAFLPVGTSSSITVGP